MKKFFTQRAVRPWHSCPEKLWVPHPWRCSGPGGMGPWAAWFRVLLPMGSELDSVLFKVPSLALLVMSMSGTGAGLWRTRTFGLW